MLVLVALLVCAVGAQAREPGTRTCEDADSLLVLNGRTVQDDCVGRDASQPTRPAPERPVAARPAPTILRGARGMAAFAHRYAIEQRRAATTAIASRPAAPSRPWYRVGAHRSITYLSRPSGDLQLDVWYPRGRKTPAPTIVLVHGGGWRTSGREEWDRVGWTHRLVHRGYVVVAPSYRMSCMPDGLTGPAAKTTDTKLCGFSMRESVVDVRRSLGWIHRNVASYGGDEDRMVLVGASAGGHLALMAGADRAAFLRGVAAISPATDLTWFGKRPKERLYAAARQAIGCPLRRCESTWREFSPANLVASARTWPDTYIYDSADDRVTPGAQNEELLKALARRGTSVTRRHPIRTGRLCHGTYSCSQWPVAGTGRSLLDDVDAWVLTRVR